MKKLIPWMTLIGLAFTGLTFYYTKIHKEKIKIEIQSLDKTQLTQTPEIKGLVAEFYFNDSIPVKNLWRIKYLIKNTGNINIIGQGVNSSLLTDGIPLRFDDNSTVLDLDISYETNAAILIDRTLHFKQWRKFEYVEITAFIECTEGEPNMYIDNRDILTADITFTDYRSLQETSNKKLIDYFPDSLQNIIKWSIVVIYTFLFILAFRESAKQVINIDGGIIIKIFTVILMILTFGIFLMPLLWMF